MHSSKPVNEECAIEIQALIKASQSENRNHGPILRGPLSRRRHAMKDFALPQ